MFINPVNSFSQRTQAGFSGFKSSKPEVAQIANALISKGATPEAAKGIAAALLEQARGKKGGLAAAQIAKNVQDGQLPRRLQQISHEKETGWDVAPREIDEKGVHHHW